MKIDLKGIHTVRKRLATGKVKMYHYAWRGGPLITSDPGSQMFAREYAQLTAKRYANKNGTLAGLIDDFTGSNDFERLSKLTKRDHAAMFKLITEKYGDMPIEVMEDRAVRGEFKKWRDTFKSDRQADRVWASLKRVFSVAVDNGKMTWNPCSMGGKRYHGTRADKIWTPELVSKFVSQAPKHVTAPFVFSLNMGQRQGDVLRLPWSAYDGERVRLVQSKTGRRVSPLANQTVRELLAAQPKSSPLVFLNSRGLPWTSHGYSASFRKALGECEIKGLTYHDTRGTFITNRRREGSSLEDIADIVGLSTKDISKVLEKHYLGHDETRADEVFLRMESTK